MIPEFPNFKKIELTDKEEIEKFTSKFLPYSDFNFVNMWSWNIKDEMRISVLNNNLVVRFTDYITGKSFYSFLGINKEVETIKELLELSKKEKLKPILKLVPEEVVKNLTGLNFDLIPDRDAHDYIYSVSHLSNMDHWTKHSSGKNIRNYNRLYPKYVVKHQSIKEIQKDEYKKMFRKWAGNKGIEDHSKLKEYEALERILKVNQKNVKVLSIYVNNILEGFTICEILSPSYAISHFAKANKTCHRAIGDLLNFEEAKMLNALGIKYLNWEQDLGMLGLRKSKEKYKPSFFLKKFTISYKN